MSNSEDEEESLNRKTKKRKLDFVPVSVTKPRLKIACESPKSAGDPSGVPLLQRFLYNIIMNMATMPSDISHDVCKTIHALALTCKWFADNIRARVTLETEAPLWKVQIVTQKFDDILGLSPHPVHWSCRLWRNKNVSFMTCSCCKKLCFPVNPKVDIFIQKRNMVCKDCYPLLNDGEQVSEKEECANPNYLYYRKNLCRDCNGIVCCSEHGICTSCADSREAREKWALLASFPVNEIVRHGFCYTRQNE